MVLDLSLQEGPAGLAKGGAARRRRIASVTISFPDRGMSEGENMAGRRKMVATKWHGVLASSGAAPLRYSRRHGRPQMTRRIAIVEDEPAIRANYGDVLSRQGYAVAAYDNRTAALAAFRTRLPDLALIDIGLGDDVDGGFALCRDLRALSATVPILFLTARDSDFDIVAGLRIGADDYLTKDVSLPHLLARVAALLRRGDLVGARAPAAGDAVITRGKLALDEKRLLALWEGRRVDLTLTEFWVVHALARFPGHVKDRDSLMRDARIVVDDSTITSHVKRIRRKFLAVDPAFDRIETVYGMGYRWDAETS
jgi:two-component system OmpR family response regulator